MAAAALKQDALLPQGAGGNAPGAALAIVVHAGLLAALTFGVDWRTHAPEVVSAELWAAVPQTAAAPAPPPPPEPTPAPTPQPVPAPPPPAKAEAPVPDITLERERKKAQEAERQRAAEQKKADDERKQREKAEAAKAAKAEQAVKAEEERIAKQREEQLRRIMAQASDGASGGVAPKGNAATTAAPSAAYAGKVRAAIRPHIVFTERLATNNAAEVEVNAAPGGSVISRKLVRSSGSREWDEAVLRAIDKAGTLPRDTDGRVPATLIITFRPSD